MAIALEELRELPPRPPLRLVPPASTAPAAPQAHPHLRSRAALRRAAAARARVRRRRAAVLAVTVLVLVSVAVLARAEARTDVTGSPPAAVEAAPAGAQASVIVGPGDTIWDLAVANRPAGTAVVDYAVAIAAHNGVDARAIRPGDVLRLP